VRKLRKKVCRMPTEEKAKAQATKLPTRKVSTMRERKFKTRI
jgi:hypothetical protein